MAVFEAELVAGLVADRVGQRPGDSRHRGVGAQQRVGVDHQGLGQEPGPDVARVRQRRRGPVEAGLALFAAVGGGADRPVEGEEQRGVLRRPALDLDARESVVVGLDAGELDVERGVVLDDAFEDQVLDRGHVGVGRCRPVDGLPGVEVEVLEVDPDGMAGQRGRGERQPGQRDEACDHRPPPSAIRRRVCAASSRT